MNKMYDVALEVARKAVNDFIDEAALARGFDNCSDWYKDWFEDEKGVIKDIVDDMADNTPYERIGAEAALRVIRTLCIDVDEEVFEAAYGVEYESLVHYRER